MTKQNLTLPDDMWYHISQQNAHAMFILSMTTKILRKQLCSYDDDITEGKVNFMHNVKYVEIHNIICCVISITNTLLNSNIINADCVIVANFDNPSLTKSTISIYNSKCSIFNTKINAIGSASFATHGISAKLSTVNVHNSSFNIFGHGACIYSIKSNIYATCCGFGPEHNNNNKHAALVLKESVLHSNNNIFTTKEPILSIKSVVHSNNNVHW